MMLLGKRHIPFYEVSQVARDCSVTFAAPTKTFNIAGVVSSYAIVPNPELRNNFFDFLKGCELDEPTIFAPIATIACYRQGYQWRDEMLAYIEDNIRFVALFKEKAHLAINDGEMFGKEGKCFMRLNVGTPRTILKKALVSL